MFPSRVQTIHIFCTDPACERRLNLPEEWTTGLCTLHADPDAAATPDAKEPDWNARLEAIDASDPRKPTGPYRAMKRED